MDIMLKIGLGDIGNRWLPQTTCAGCAGCSGNLLTPSPPR
jgi:hypothetical protein